VRPADALPSIPPENLAADCACGILYNGKRELLSDFEHCLEIARHSHLMYTQDCPRAAADSRSNALRIDVERCGIYINEHGHSPAIPDGVGACDKRMTNCDDFAPWVDSYSPERKMKRSGAVRDRTRMARADIRREFFFKCSDFRTLGHPAI
jgi:hypothetical protein